jgi:hypothetical protein
VLTRDRVVHSGEALLNLVGEEDSQREFECRMLTDMVSSEAVADWFERTAEPEPNEAGLRQLWPCMACGAQVEHGPSQQAEAAVQQHDLVGTAVLGTRTLQELPGHQDVRTTMTCRHVLNRGLLGARSPADTV